MNHQFKPGDLAMIVGAFNVTSNIGMSCELVERLEPEQISTWVDPNDGSRIQNATGQPGWLVVGDGLTSYNGDAGWVLAGERHLMPIPGDENPDAHLATSAPRQAVTA